ncbi:MAG TPA: hypothetical protein VK001_13320, partial [Geminicoccaceae bacterium]|nr:hypothetical protein [Geminicoccaceae bacterium]
PPDPIHEVESQPSTGALLAPVLERYETLNWEAALVLASPYRPLDGQLDHLRKELAELSESLRSIDPENKLEAAADLRAGLDKLGKAISAAEGLPRAPQPKTLEEDYAKVKGKQSEPLAATIKLAKDPKILPKILTTAAPVAPGQRFYAEDQRYLACAVHALNAFIGGPLVSVEALSEFNMVQAHVEQVAPLLHVPDQDASRGNEADVPYKFLCYMRDYKALPHDVAFHLIDRVSSDPTAQKEVPAIPGDRCIVNTQNPAHFVAFRKDTAGVWWLIDSAPRASQRKMTPEDYIRERMQDPQNGFIAVTTLRS